MRSALTLLLCLAAGGLATAPKAAADTAALTGARALVANASPNTGDWPWAIDPGNILSGIVTPNGDWPW